MDSDKLPPQAIDMEESLIAAILLSRDAAAEIFESVSPDHFYKTAHQKIISAGYELYQKGEVIDAAILAEALGSKGLLESVGGGSYIARLMDAPIPSSIAKYCETIRQKAARRNLIEICTKTVLECYEAHDSTDVLIETAQQRIMKVQAEDSGQAFSIDDLLDGALSRYEALEKNSGKVTGIPSFYPDLDAILNGYQSTDLIILAARPGMGKTAFAINNMVRMGMQDIPCGIFSLEMSKDQIVDRITAISARVNSLKFRSGRFADTDWLEITSAFGNLAGRPIWIDDSPDSRISNIRKKARQLVRQGIRILFIDYLQLISGGNKQNRNLEISEITRSLKLMAKELNIPVVLLSQLSRKVEERNNKRPLLSDLRDSGAIEQDADVVMFLYRDEVYNKDENNPIKGVAELIIGKQRNGPTGTINLIWNKAQTRFDPISITVANQSMSIQ